MTGKLKRLRAEATHCRYCGQAFHGKITATFDHFYPLDKQGPNRHWNRFIVCRPCNQDKGNKMPQEFVIHLLHKIRNNKDINTKYFTRASKTIANMLIIQEQIWHLFEAKDIL